MVGSITPLVYLLFVQRNLNYVWKQYFVENLSLKFLWRRTCIYIWLDLFDLVN